MTPSLPLNPDLPVLPVRCAPWGRPATLLLVLPDESLEEPAPAVLAAFWAWHRRGEREDFRDVVIGRA